jgi:hypothetical protein
MDLVTDSGRVEEKQKKIFLSAKRERDSIVTYIKTNSMALSLQANYTN